MFFTLTLADFTTLLILTLTVLHVSVILRKAAEIKIPRISDAAQQEKHQGVNSKDYDSEQLLFCFLSCEHVTLHQPPLKRPPDSPLWCQLTWHTHYLTTKK